jgi:hypothetical protein
VVMEGRDWTAGSLLEALDAVPDHRSRHGRRYRLSVVLGVSVCAMLCGCRSLYAIAQWCGDHRRLVTRAFGIERGTTPSVATLHRVFKGLDVAAFQAVVSAWLSCRFVRVGEGIAVDGKSLRGLHGDQVAGVDVVAAYGHQSGVVLAQKRVPGVGQELEAGRDLLELLRVEGHVVTGDALYAQRDICAGVVGRGGTTCSS